MAWLVYKKKDTAIFPMLVNFGVGIFIFADAIGTGHVWLLLVAPFNLLIGIGILVRNLDLFTGSRKEEE